MRRRFATYGVLLLAGSLTFAIGERPARAEPTILEPQEAEGFVTVEDVTLDEDRVSGVVVNRRPNAVCDVRLVIGHVYRWPSEFKPGEESPNTAETRVLEREIPAGERVPFSMTVKPPSPPASAFGGTFVTKVEVLGFTEVPAAEPPPVASPPRQR